MRPLFAPSGKLQSNKFKAQVKWRDGCVTTETVLE